MLLGASPERAGRRFFQEDLDEVTIRDRVPVQFLWGLEKNGLKTERRYGSKNKKP